MSNTKQLQTVHVGQHFGRLHMGPPDPEVEPLFSELVEQQGYDPSDTKALDSVEGYKATNPAIPAQVSDAPVVGKVVKTRASKKRVSAAVSVTVTAMEAGSQPAPE